MVRRLIFLVSLLSVSCLAQETAPVSVKVVKGAPFSADAVTESTQVLADGNRIVRKHTASIARDGAGRTRRQQSIAGGASIIVIQDPVASAGYMIDPRTKSARRMAVPAGDGKSTKALPDKGEPVGMQLIEGVMAEGTRFTRTLAPGEAGNEGPLDIVTEAWYSSDLQTVVMTKTTDPRLGETVYKLTAVRRGEPDHALFEVPADYAMKEDAAVPSKGKAERLRAPIPQSPKKPTITPKKKD